MTPHAQPAGGAEPTPVNPAGSSSVTVTTSSVVIVKLILQPFSISPPSEDTVSIT